MAYIRLIVTDIRTPQYFDVKEKNKMKTLVVYYSLEGNTKYISEIIANELNADLIELHTKKQFPSSGFKKYFWGGKSVLFKEQPELTKPYDSIILGTPIWAGTYAAPLNTFLKQYKMIGKDIALIACHAGGGADKCFSAMRKALGSDNNMVGQIDFIEPLKRDKDGNFKKAVKWSNSLKMS